MQHGRSLMPGQKIGEIMNPIVLDEMFTQELLEDLLPPEKSDQFFEALYGDVSEGAYDIQLKYLYADPDRITMSFNLTKRPKKCLVCSLTYGLPTVFSRHPVIDIKGIINKIEQKTGVSVKHWHLGKTVEKSPSLHVIPLYLDLA